MNSIPPTDTGQALTRVVLVALVVIWTLMQSGGLVLGTDFFRGQVLLPIAYLAFAFVSLAVFLHIDSSQDPSDRRRLVFRFICISSDICALGAYTATSHDLAIVLLPIYLTYIIGNGFRFGLSYFVAAMVMSLIGFTIAIRFNSYLTATDKFLWMYYLSMIFVPLYSLGLLLKYQKTLRQLRDITIELDSFIGTMSHEFRTPLHTILSLATTTRSEETRSGDTQSSIPDSANRFRLIELCCERLLSVVNRVVRDAMAMNDISCQNDDGPKSIKADVKDVADICRVQAMEKGIDFHWFVDSNVPAYTNLSSSVIQEVLINLVDNAVKYTTEGAVQLGVAMGGGNETKTLLIVVEDSGIGIDNKSPYRRIKETFGSRSNVLSSAGLGLKITRNQIRRLGGDIDFRNRKRGGTQCIVNLPLIEETIEIEPRRKWLIAARISNAPLSDSMIRHFSTSGIIVEDIGANQFDKYLDRLHEYDVILSGDCEHLLFAFKALTQRVGSRLLPVIAISRPCEGLSDFYGTPINTAFDENDPSSIERLTTYFRDRRPDPSVLRNHGLVGRSLLLIDDSEMIVDLSAQVMRNAGAEVDTSTTYMSAINKLNAKTYDFVITDQNLDEADGCVIVEAARAGRNRASVVVVLTGDSSSNLKGRAIKKGANLVLVKPIAPGALIEKILDETTEKSNASFGSSAMEGLEEAIENVREVISSFESKIEMEHMLESFRSELLHDLTALLAATNEDRMGEARKLLHRLIGLAQTLHVRQLLGDFMRIASHWEDETDIPVGLLRDIGNSYFDATEVYRAEFRTQRTSENRGPTSVTGSGATAIGA